MSRSVKQDYDKLRTHTITIQEQAYQLEALRTDMQDAMADAWDEGYDDGRRQDAEGDDGPHFVNPYRKAP